MTRKITTVTPHGTRVIITEGTQEASGVAVPIELEIVSGFNGHVTKKRWALNTAYAVHVALGEYFGQLISGECTLEIEEL